MWQLYLRSWRMWWVPALAQALVSGVYQAWLLRRLPPLPQDLAPALALSQFSAYSAFASTGAFWLALLAAVLASTLPFIALVLGFDRLLEGEALAGPELLRRALPLWPGAMLALIGYLAAITVGTLLFIVPGAWISGRWVLWPVALVRQGGGFEALERGAALVRGRWWQVNAWVTVVFLLALLGNMVVGAVLGVLSEPLAALAGASLAAPALPLALASAARGQEFR